MKDSRSHSFSFEGESQDGKPEKEIKFLGVRGANTNTCYCFPLKPENVFHTNLSVEEIQNIFQEQVEEMIAKGTGRIVRTRQDLERDMLDPNYRRVVGLPPLCP